MNMEFRSIHLEMLALPMGVAAKPLSNVELDLAKEFEEECAITRGLVLATKRASSRRYMVVLGGEVVRAAEKAHVQHIPCLIAETFTDLFIELIKSNPETNQENPESAKFEDVIKNAIDSYRELKGTHLSYRKAETIGKLGKKSTLYDAKRLAENLDPRVQDMVKDSRLSKSAARSISYVTFSDQYNLAKSAIQNGWTVKEIELAKSNTKDYPVDASIYSDLETLQNDLEEAWGSRVTITPKTRQTGLLRFELYDIEDAITLCRRLAQMTREFTYSIKGKHPAVRVSKSGIFEVQYKDLDTVDELREVLRSSSLGSVLMDHSI